MSQPDQEGPALHLPYQMDVYFESMPEVDVPKLQAFVNECDPDENDTCEITAVESPDPSETPLSKEAGLKLSGLHAALGDLQIMILIHNVPSPAIHTIENATMPDQEKAKLKSHRSFALLTNSGGEVYAPFENTILLYKVGLGLCQQGALGLGFVHTGLCFRSEFLLDLEQKIRAFESDDGKPVTLWRTIREEGEPSQLLVDYVAVPAQTLGLENKDALALITRGFAHVGFPDLMFLASDEKEAVEIKELFENVYHYMFENGPVIQPGHSMGDESGDAVFRFHELPKDLKIPFETFDLIFVTREEK